MFRSSCPAAKRCAGSWSATPSSVFPPPPQLPPQPRSSGNRARPRPTIRSARRRAAIRSGRRRLWMPPLLRCSHCRRSRHSNRSRRRSRSQRSHGSHRVQLSPVNRGPRSRRPRRPNGRSWARMTPWPQAVGHSGALDPSPRTKDRRGSPQGSVTIRFRVTAGRQRRVRLPRPSPNPCLRRSRHHPRHPGACHRQPSWIRVPPIRQDRQTRGPWPKWSHPIRQ